MSTPSSLTLFRRSVLASRIPCRRVGYKTIKVAVENEVAIMTLNRPNKKNAFNKDMYLELGSALKAYSASRDCKVILLTAQGDFFSSGNDLSNFSQIMHPLTMAKSSRDLCENFVNSFIDCEKPIICAVNGPAIGIAATIQGLMDVVICTPNATFRTPFKELGQSPEGCSSFMFPRLLGASNAGKLLDEGATFTAEDALKSGLVKEVIPEGELLLRSLKYCEELAALPSESEKLVRHLKRQNLIEKLHEVNKQECDECQRTWICKESFNALSKYLLSRKMYSAAVVLQFANATGFLWGQPK